MASPYYCLNSAYDETSLQNPPDPVTGMHYPCIVSYPFLTEMHPPTRHVALPTDYTGMSKSYDPRPCQYHHCYGK